VAGDISRRKKVKEELPSPFLLLKCPIISRFRQKVAGKTRFIPGNFSK
jgi:hypothetical protein